MYVFPELPLISKPDYLNIIWPGPQNDVMPMPYERLGTEEWLELLLNPRLTMIGYGVDKLYLPMMDWDAQLFFYPHMVLMGLFATKPFFERISLPYTQFYRLGCQHKGGTMIENLENGLKKYICLDCFYSSVNSTDG